MTVLLREHNIPARFVEGFLPGTLDKRTGVEQVFNSNAHAWVEVYFPGYGWFMFDRRERPGRDGSAAQRQTGGERPAEQFPSLANNPLGEDGRESRKPGAAVAGAAGRDGGVGPGGFILIAAVLFAAMALARLRLSGGAVRAAR